MPKIIIVDDDLLLRRTMQRVLTAAEYEVLICRAVDDPHPRIRMEQPHLIILDLQKGPGAPEWEQLNALHADPATANLAVLVASSDALLLRKQHDELRRRSCALLEMPFTPAELLAKIGECIGPGNARAAVA